MSRYDRIVRGGLAAALLLYPALLLYGVTSTAPAYAAPADALMPIEKYTTPKSRGLANAHRLRLIEFSEQIYNCMPWLAVYPGRLGFPKYKDSADDDRYLSMWIWVDQRDDPVFAALPQERRVSAMFSRYGVDMLRRMAALSDVVDDSERMARHLGFRNRVFLAPRLLSFYTGEDRTNARLREAFVNV